MAFKFTAFYVGGVLCIWLCNQVSSEESAPCSPDEDASCYLNYTQEILHAALGADLQAYAQSGKNSDELCSSLSATSTCLENLEDCSTNDEYQRREEAYAAQRDIFCTPENLQAYAEAAICIAQQPDFKDCIQQLPKMPKDSMAQNGYDCTVGAKRLECLDQHMDMCSEFKTGIVRRTYVNSQLLAGCDSSAASMPRPETSASDMDMLDSNFTSFSQSSDVVTAGASTVVMFGQPTAVGLLASCAVMLYRKVTSGGIAV